MQHGGRLKARIKLKLFTWIRASRLQLMFDSQIYLFNVKITYNVITCYKHEKIIHKNYIKMFKNHELSVIM